MKKICISALVAMSMASCAVFNGGDFSAKRNVDGVQGTLKLHPDKVIQKGKDGKEYYFFYDFPNKTIFITTNEKLYTSFEKHLPEVVVSGRQILLEGPVIDPFTKFTKDQWEAEGKRLGIDLGEFKVAAIFNYGLVTDATRSTTSPSWRQ